VIGVSLRWRHAVLGLLALVLGALAFAGCLGPAVGDERISAYDVAAVVRADDTVLVREVIDYDFGGESRHGIFRDIPSDLGRPTEVRVTSETAPDEVSTLPLGGGVRLQIGDPDETIGGRHRYVVTYVLPEGVQDGDRFALDAIGDAWPVASDDVTVTVLGAELADARCFTGGYGSTDRCPIEEVDDAYVTEIDHLDAHEAVTVEGDVVEVRDATLPPVPPFEDRDEGARMVWGLVVTGLALVAAAAVFVACRQLGRNEVAGGGATQAAFFEGDPAAASFGPDAPEPAGPPPGVELVADTAMAGLAGLDFAPPRGVEPWQAAVVLRERIDDTTVGAWFASLAGHDVLEIGRTGDEVVLRPGPRAPQADATVAPILNRALGGRDEVRLGEYDPRFSTAWSQAGEAIEGWTLAAGVFRRRPPTFGRNGLRAGGTALPPIACLVPAVVVLLAGAGGVLVAGMRTAVGGVLVALAVPALAALVAYRPLTRSLSARGSAIALRSESFRRFLHDSEAQHVEWAWQNSLLREYSAWAVALGEATAWNAALSASSVPPVEVDHSRGVLMPYLYLPSFTSASTAPPPASSGGGFSGGGFSGGGFSGGGFSGGGGGGGGGGSW
jgi:uncharacterized membrane protein YgcG